MIFNKHQEGWTKSKMTSEFLFLLQNLMSVFFFALSVIPFILYKNLCKADETDEYECYDTFFKRLVLILYKYSCRKAIWRAWDEIVAFGIQTRIYFNLLKKEKTPRRSWMNNCLKCLKKKKVRKTRTTVISVISNFNKRKTSSNTVSQL